MTVIVQINYSVILGILNPSKQTLDEKYLLSYVLQVLVYHRIGTCTHSVNYEAMLIKSLILWEKTGLIPGGVPWTALLALCKTVSRIHNYDIFSVH